MKIIKIMCKKSFPSKNTKITDSVFTRPHSFEWSEFSLMVFRNFKLEIERTYTHEAVQTTSVFCLDNKMLKISNRNKNFDM